jgi:hypothetical protein
MYLDVINEIPEDRSHVEDDICVCDSAFADDKYDLEEFDDFSCSSESVDDEISDDNPAD